MINKRWCLPMLVAGLAAGPVAAEMSGQLAYVSDYRFRGLSQSAEDMALQGAVEFSLPYGAYAGTWASSVDFADGDQASTELDLYTGIGGSWSDHVDWGLALSLYTYPGASSALDYDYFEILPSLALSGDVGSIELSAAYSPEFFGRAGESYYVHLMLSAKLPAQWTLTAGAGKQYIQRNQRFGVPDYVDWRIGVERPALGLTWSVTAVGTDIDGVDCFGGADTCDEAVVAAAMITF